MCRSKERTPGRPGVPDGTARPGPRRVALAVLAVSALVALLYLVQSRTTDTDPKPSPDPGQRLVSDSPTAGGGPVSADDVAATNQGAYQAIPRTALNRPDPIASTPATSSPGDPLSAAPSPRELVDSIVRAAPFNRPPTPEEATAWQQDLSLLASQGPAAVPAILEFLEKHLDYPFDAETEPALGYTSVRAALFDVLLHIGGAEGLEATRQTIRNTADPREIAILALNLETMAPEEHRVEAVESARQSLAMAARGELPGEDVAPLFEVLAHYGRTAALTDLEQSMGQWKYYAVQALAQLPDAAGIPSLLHLAESDAAGQTSPGRDAALQMLTQLAAENPDARAALLALTAANRIQPALWPGLAPLLAGDRIHLENSVLNADQSVTPTARTTTAHVAWGNQHFYYAPPDGQLAPEQAQLRLELITELAAVTSEPEAIRVLEQSRAQLEGRLRR